MLHLFAFLLNALDLSLGQEWFTRYSIKNCQLKAKQVINIETYKIYLQFNLYLFAIWLVMSFDLNGFCEPNLQLQLSVKINFSLNCFSSQIENK